MEVLQDILNFLQIGYMSNTLNINISREASRSISSGIQTTIKAKHFFSK
jgi:hypothetical protein